jgi:ATP-binding protein involved in chromosome partitioning
MTRPPLKSKGDHLTPETILHLLKSIKDPISGGPLTSSRREVHVSCQENKIIISIEIAPEEKDAFKAIEEACRDLLKHHVSETVQVTLTYHRPSPEATMTSLSSITHVIAIASGKGGVGKSTVAFNLALTLKGQGLRVGLLDADIYGPSLPQLVQRWDQPEITDQGSMEPLSAFGLKMQSIGFLMPPQQPALWRGPMAQAHFLKLLHGSEWGNLDILIIDLPPGTGDIHLTMAQKVPLTGAVIVTTPQDLALIDALKAIKLFETLHVPILGLIENMSFLTCPHCQQSVDLFGQGGSHQLSQDQAIDSLGSIPLHRDLRLASDKGTPITLKNHPHHPIAQSFQGISQSLMKKLHLFA